MVTTRITVVEHAKQLVSHGAHAADIEVVEGLLAELEKSKKTIENLQELTRKQFGLVQLSEPLRNLQPSPDMITDVVASVRKLQEAAHEFEYLNNSNESFIMNGGAEVYMELPTPTRHARPPLEQYDDVVPALARSKE